MTGTIGYLKHSPDAGFFVFPFDLVRICAVIKVATYNSLLLFIVTASAEQSIIMNVCNIDCERLDVHSCDTGIGDISSTISGLGTPFGAGIMGLLSESRIR